MNGRSIRTECCLLVALAAGVLHAQDSIVYAPELLEARPSQYTIGTELTTPTIVVAPTTNGVAFPVAAYDSAVWWYGNTNGVGVSVTNSVKGTNTFTFAPSLAQMATNGLYQMSVTAYKSGTAEEWVRGTLRLRRNYAASAVPWDVDPTGTWVTYTALAASGTVWRAEWVASVDHAAISNLAWTASGHTGTAGRLAGFFEGGQAGYAGFGAGVYLDGDDNVAVSNAVIAGAAAGATAVQPAALAAAAVAATNYVDGGFVQLTEADDAVTIDAANARTNTYGGYLTRLGTMVQFGPGSVASGDSGSFAFGFYSTASGAGGSAAIGSGATASGIDGCIALGTAVISSHPSAFAWSGRMDQYGSHDAGTFNIDPEGGVSGLWIGEETLGGILGATQALLNVAAYVAATNSVAALFVPLSGGTLADGAALASGEAYSGDPPTASEDSWGIDDARVWGWTQSAYFGDPGWWRLAHYGVGGSAGAEAWSLNWSGSFTYFSGAASRTAEFPAKSGTVAFVGDSPTVAQANASNDADRAYADAVALAIRYPSTMRLGIALAYNRGGATTVSPGISSNLQITPDAANDALSWSLNGILTQCVAIAYLDHSGAAVTSGFAIVHSGFNVGDAAPTDEYPNPEVRAVSTGTNVERLTYAVSKSPAKTLVGQTAVNLQIRSAGSMQCFGLILSNCLWRVDQ